MRFAGTIAVAALALLALPASAQNGTVHRTDAGTLDAGGWTDANSTEGAFSVRMPCLYEDTSISKPQHTGPATIDLPVAGYIVDCRLDDGSTFGVMRIVARDEASAERIFAQIIALSEVPESDQRRFTFKGAEALDLTHPNTDDRCVLSRMIRIGTDDIIAVAERPGPTCAGLETDAKIFFDSLEVKPR